MKRLKIILPALLAVTLAGLFSCKSAPIVSDVDPLDLLDGSSSFYLRIPQKADPALISRMLQNNLQGLSESDADRITQRIDTVYMGIRKSRKGSDFQLATSCNFPQIAVNTAFSKKNGWKSEKLSLDSKLGKPVVYTVYDNSGLLASFPSLTTGVMGRGVPAMVERYHNLLQYIESAAYDSLDENARQWLSYENELSDAQVRFFASKPQSFLTTLTGANLNFKLIYVKGYLENDPENDSQYRMQLEFEFRDSRVVGAAKAMLSVAFGLTDSNVRLTTDTHLIISGIKINKNQLYKILVI